MLGNDDSLGRHAAAASGGGLDSTLEQGMMHGREEDDADPGYDDLMALMQELKANRPKRVHHYTHSQYAKGRRYACMYTHCMCAHTYECANCTSSESVVMGNG